MMGIVRFFRFFFALPARSALLIPGRRGHRSHAPQSSQLSQQVQLAIPCCVVALSTLFAICCSSFVPLHFATQIFLSSGCSKLPQSMLYGSTTHAIPDLVLALVPSHVGHPGTLPAKLLLPSTLWTAESVQTLILLGCTTHSVLNIFPLHFSSSPHLPTTSFHITAFSSQCY